MERRATADLLRMARTEGERAAGFVRDAIHSQQQADASEPTWEGIETRDGWLADVAAEEEEAYWSARYAARFARAYREAKREEAADVLADLTADARRRSR